MDFINYLIELSTDPALMSALGVIIGVVVKAVAPKWLPVLGKGRKLVHELTVLHSRNNLTPAQIKAHAVELGLKKAEKWIKGRI